MPNWGAGAAGAGRGALSGAGTGAMIGSFGGPIGMGIGAGAGAIYGGLRGLFGGGDDEDEAAKVAAGDPNIDPLRESAAALRQKGAMLGGQGQQALAPTLAYYQALIGQDPGALMAATAPERGRVIDQYDSARRAAAEFGPRGGATNAAIANSHFQQAQQLGDITSMAKRDATSQLAALGATMTGLGLSADQLASMDLNAVIQAVLGQEYLDVQRRGQTMAMWSGVGEAAGGLAGLYLTREGGAWGGGGGGTSGGYGGPTIDRNPWAGAS